ncbi:ABC transporter substrate-binding protein [Iodobacter sp. CM08]|uniref:substrate-binding periplasmic protein n=1 Tax=Iodobacter sp. CM08 TaxID=3085902 RepID=UPI002980F130|nr:ABC transporter substrate-binding protein [Iodobacter sp. CM08]MDW5416349.1 ABC transporter substrate-binding protein [Iodobacter sp. CM08]
MHYFIACLLFMISGISAQSAELRVRIASGEFQPYLSASLPNDGFISKIIAAAFKQENVVVAIAYYPWKRSYDMVKKGEADLTPFWVKAPEREQLFILSDPIDVVQYGFFHLKNKKITLLDFNNLNQYKVGVSLGYSYGSAFDTARKNQQFICDEAPSDEINIRKLIAKRIDLFTADKTLGQYLISKTLQPKDAEKITFFPKNFAEEPVYLLISKRIKNGAEIADKFNKGLKKMKQSGEYQRIMQEEKNN